MPKRKTVDLPPLVPGARVFLYVRDSGGASQEASVGQQRERLTTWAAERGYQVLACYTDERRPGSTDNREAFLAMIDVCCVAQPPVAAVLAWDFSRFSRNEIDRAYYVSLLARHGVRMVSITQSLPDGPLAGVMREVLSFTDSEYLRSLSRNVKRGLQASARLGRHAGMKPPAGYLRTQMQIGVHRDGTPRTVQRWAVDETLAPAIREAFALYAAGAAMREIHARLNLLASYDGYRHMFDNPVYIGQVKMGDTLLPEPELRIVDDATWAAVQARRAHRLPPRQVRSSYLLSGLLVCGDCGGRMNGQTYRRNYGANVYRYYACNHVSDIGYTCHNRVRAEVVDAPVLAAVTGSLSEPAQVASLVATLAERSAADPQPAAARALDAEIAAAERAIAGLLDVAEVGTLALPEIRRRLAERETGLAELRARRAALPVTVSVIFDAERVRARLAAIAADLGAGDVPVVRRALAAVLARVEYAEASGVVIIYREVI